MRKTLSFLERVLLFIREGVAVEYVSCEPKTQMGHKETEQG